MRKFQESATAGSIFAADTSVIVNLLATGISARILNPFKMNIVLVPAVLAELRRGAAAGHRDFRDDIAQLAQSEIKMTGAKSVTNQTWLNLMPPALSFGEAQTIAYAHQHSCGVLTDDRAAAAFCQKTGIATLNTTDLLSAPRLIRQLGKKELAAATYRALTEAKMYVPPKHYDWLSGLLARKHRRNCPSLPKKLR